MALKRIGMSHVLRCLRVVSFLVVFWLNQIGANAERNVSCPSIANGMFGDLRHHFGCIKPDFNTPENKMEVGATTSSMTRMKPDQLHLPSYPEWLIKLSEHLLSSTVQVNSFNQEGIDEANSNSSSSDCGSDCPSRSPPQCCRAESRLLFPLYGRSLTSGRLVRIAQDLDPNGIQQPVVYRHCLSERTEWVRGRCHQSTLPRLFFIPTTGSGTAAGGYPYRQDLILVPSNCECLVTVGGGLDVDGGGPHNDDDNNDADEWNGPSSPTNINAGSSTTLSSLVEGSGTDVSGAAIEATLQEDGLFRHQDS